MIPDSAKMHTFVLFVFKKKTIKSNHDAARKLQIHQIPKSPNSSNFKLRPLLNFSRCHFLRWTYSCLPCSLDSAEVAKSQIWASRTNAGNLRLFVIMELIFTVLKTISQSHKVSHTSLKLEEDDEILEEVLSWASAARLTELTPHKFWRDYYCSRVAANG